MSRKTKTPFSGQLLLADFQNVFVSTATAEAARFEAQKSESDLMNHLNTISRGSYLQPGTIGQDLQTDVARASLDAHIKKVQAEQLDSMTAEQTQNLIAADRNAYRGQKVTVKTIVSGLSPIELVLFDERNGYRSNTSRRKTVSGTIEEVLLDKNMLILKPSWRARVMNSGLQNYLIYVIDPDTLNPMIEFDAA
jgi:hypothetical protein